MPESSLYNEARLAASKNDAALFRNNVGVLPDGRGGYLRFGLAVGSGDLIGYRTLTITQDMVGAKIAQFVSVEAKAKRGKEQTNQDDWRNAINSAGGLAVKVKTVEDVVSALTEK